MIMIYHVHNFGNVPESASWLKGELPARNCAVSNLSESSLSALAVWAVLKY
jgi:hypothetical protein